MIRLRAYLNYLKSNIKILSIKFFNPFGKLISDVRVNISSESKFCIGKKSKIILGKNCSIRSGCIINAREGAYISLDKGVSINYNCIITAYSKIEIGEGTLIGPNTCFYDHDHDFRCKEGLSANKYLIDDISIGKNVWIGANCIILRGTMIGDNVVIGAGSIVKGNIQSNTVMYQKRISEYKEMKVKNNVV